VTREREWSFAFCQTVAAHCSTSKCVAHTTNLRLDSCRHVSYTDLLPNRSLSLSSRMNFNLCNGRRQRKSALNIVLRCAKGSTTLMAFKWGQFAIATERLIDKWRWGRISLINTFRVPTFFYFWIARVRERKWGGKMSNMKINNRRSFSLFLHILSHSLPRCMLNNSGFCCVRQLE
jgi:hypothetical protein